MTEIQVVHPATTTLVKYEPIGNLLGMIRPAWQAKDLIARVRKLLPVDPSSACQRVFNASIHDMRDKVIIAGVDIAKDAAKENKLPPVERAIDVEDYPTSKLIDLSYHMGIITHPQWRRLSRVYEIRRDLEHEDDEYEAEIEDVLYVFKTCVEVVLARDPIRPLPVTDVKEVVEQPNPAIPSPALLEDFEHAPQPRQLQIMGMLVNLALDSGKAQVVRHNAFVMLKKFDSITLKAVKLDLAQQMQKKIGRTPMDITHGRVAYASGTIGYLDITQRASLFEHIHTQLKDVGTDWTEFNKHGEILRTLKELGGLMYTPPKVRLRIVHWMVSTYIGEPGGYGHMGRNRKVFYSDTAAPLILEILRDSAQNVGDDIRSCEKLPDVERAITNTHIARRYQTLLDIVSA